MPKYGTLEPFDSESQVWQEYLERMEQFFAANEVPATKQRAVFLSCCESPTYSTLRSLLASIKPTEATLEASLQRLGYHYLPQPSLMVSRFKFHSRVRQEGESISDYVA
ncbi:unnamed protein product [Ixodes persulcatus]